MEVHARRPLRAAPDAAESGHRDCGLDVTEGGIWPWARYRQMIEEELKKNG